MTRRLTETKSWEEIVEQILEASNEQNNKDFRKWLMSKKELGHYFFSELVWFQCYQIHKKLSNQTKVKDHVIVIDGDEGTGKSTLANQIAKVVDPEFSLQNVCYKPIHFFQNLKDLKPGRAVTIDEGVIFLFSREAMTDTNRAVVKTIQQMRWRQLLTIICIPSIINLESDIRKRRVNHLIHILNNGNLVYFFDRLSINKMVSDANKKRLLTIMGADWVPGSYFYGHNINENPIDDYLVHKEKNWDEWIDSCIENAEDKDIKSKFVSITQAMKILPVKRDTFVKYLRDGTVIGKKVGEKWFIDRASLENVESRAFGGR